MLFTSSFPKMSLADQETPDIKAEITEEVDLDDIDGRRKYYIN